MNLTANGLARLLFKNGNCPLAAPGKSSAYIVKADVMHVSLL